MEVKFYHGERAGETLLLYFAGWGTTAEAVGHLALPEGWDFAAFSDYRDLSAELPPFEGYRQVFLAAWSMGVWAADKLADRLPKPDRAVAVNGTPPAVHDRYGIPEEGFRRTLRNLREMNREQFDRRMAGGRKLLELFRTFHARSTGELEEELLAAYDGSAEARRIGEWGDRPRAALPWTQALVSERDLIVPPGNQTAFWEASGVPVTLLRCAGHYPFRSFASWAELFDERLERFDLH